MAGAQVEEQKFIENEVIELISSQRALIIFLLDQVFFPSHFVFASSSSSTTFCAAPKELNLS